MLIMKLENWLKKEKKTQKWLADRLGVTRATINRAASGQLGSKTARKIVEATDNEVTFNDLYS